MAALNASYNNNSARNLSNEQLFRIAPSIFAVNPSADRSDKYAFISSLDVVEALRGEGFFPVAAAESKARKEEKHGYTKHAVRFRNHDGFAFKGQIISEIVWRNAHDGTGAGELIKGARRLACDNGLIVDAGTIASQKTRHSGDVSDVIEGVYELVKEDETLYQTIEEMQAVQMPEPIQRVFAKTAAGLRWDTDAAPIDTDRLLTIRRSADRSSDVFTTFNVIQENLLRGGLRGKNANGGRLSTRAVNSVSENIKINRALWAMAEEIKNLLAA